jgi:hypothetical protein
MARDSQEDWLRTRGYLNGHRYELTQSVVGLYPGQWRVAGTPMLAPPAWRPAAPVPLDQVTLSWCADGAGPAGTGLDGRGLDSTGLDGTGPESAAVRPVRDDGRRFASYADALGALSRPRLFEDRTCYRILGAGIPPDGAGLEFAAGRYFQMINTCEAAAHEYAAAALAGDHPALEDLPLRSAIGDPADLRRRPAMSAVGTLTLRADRAAGDAAMILHWRDPARVATGGGLYQVAPVGMFQPSHDAEWNLANDFSLWRAIAREMAEELLGGGEDYHSDAAPIDYERWPLQATLAAARRAGTLRLYWLGLGLDPLTLVVDMLSVAVFDAPVFDAVFAGLVHANDEGHMVASQDETGATTGLPFTAAAVERFTTDEPMQSAGAALLRTAWEHRDALLAH